MHGQDPDLCNELAVTTGEPCRFNIRFKPCPHHGPGSQDNLCGEPTKSGRPCRWNELANGGPCPNHVWGPNRVAREQEQRRQQQEERERQRLEDEQQAREREEEMRLYYAEVREYPCPNPVCTAAAGQECVDREGRPYRSRRHGEVHSERQSLEYHTIVTTVVSCPRPQCMSALGEFCVTRHGTDSIDPHKVRVAAAVAERREGSATPSP